jgi:single-strand DNA-binding protein
MNNLRNNVQLIGYLGKEVELLEFEKGNKIAKVTMATNEQYTNSQGEKVEDTQWHNLVAYGKVGEWMKQLLAKGAEVLVNGKINYRSYENDKGETKYITEVVVRDFLKFGKKD